MSPIVCGRLSSLLARLLLMVIALASACQLAHAQTSQSSCIVTTRGAPDVLDVVFLFECSNVETVGALHYDVQTVSGPSSSDRDLEIVLTLSPNSEGRTPTVHRQAIRLKEGATSARGTIPFVMNSTTDANQQRTMFWNVAVREDGRDAERSRTLQASPGGQYIPIKLASDEPPPYMMHHRGTQTGAILFVLDSGAKLDTRIFNRVTPPNVKNAGAAAFPAYETPTFDLARDIMRATHTRHVESLPEYWHYYLQFVAVTVDPPALAKLRAERPRVAAALKQYVAAGGDLIFVSSEMDAPRLLDQWLTGRDDAHHPTDWFADLKTFRSTTELYSEDDLRMVTELTDAARAAQVVDPNGTLPPAQDTPTDKVDYKRYAVRQYARGRLICIENSRDVVFPTAFLANRATPVGLTVSSVHDGSWSLRNTIASVGKPPVWTFCAIILLFGLILGPGLLVLTGWIGRRSLLILLVPLVSIGATLAIVGYEVLHEGFGTYARISSVLCIDERTGDGFVWSRQNYFSGWPPREGLTIPNDVYCRPVGGLRLGRAGNTRNAATFQYTVEHKADESSWLGVLQAREQKQLLLGHPAKLSMPIQVKRIDDKRVTLRNLTEETLPFVVLRDGKTGYYFAENVAPKSDIELESVPFGDFAGALSRLRTELSPALPAELRAIGWAVAQDQSVTEVLDQDWIGSMAEQSAISTIQPYGFVTLIRNCSDVFVPLKATTSESLHLVTGSAVW